MNVSLKIETNIALVPEPRLADYLTEASCRIARRYGAVVRLGKVGPRLSLAPHLTLYQAALPLEGLPELNEVLSTIAHTERPPYLTSIGLAYNEREGSIEDRKEAVSSLVTLQDRVISMADPLRNGLLLERDPAGHNVADLLLAPGRLGENIRATGYGEVGDPATGGLFRPHDTLNWLEPGTQIDLAYEQSVLNIEDMSGLYPAIGLFAIGPYGTCPQLLARYELAA